MKTIVISINSSWNIVNFRKGLIAALLGHGYRVVVVAPADRYSPQLAALGVDFIPLHIDKQGTSPARDLLLLWRTFRVLRRLRPDAYLGYTAKPNIYGSLAAHLLGIPVINNVAGLGTAFIQHGWLTRIVTRLYRVAFGRSKTVFFQNSDDRALFIDTGLVRPDQARLLPGSGIDLAQFDPTPPPARERAPITFLLIARLLWDKGVGEYVEAARLVRAELADARFQMLGFLDVANRSAIGRADVQQWTDEGIIDYLGEADDVRPFIQAADCIVLPSYREGLPRVLLEGGAMARPLVATDVPGCRQAVQHGVSGYLCEVRNARSLADAMLRIARLPASERRAMGEAARAHIETHYDERIVIEQYLSALDEALQPA